MRQVPADDRAEEPAAATWLAGPPSRYLRISLACLSVGAAVIHFAVMTEHFAQYWLFGVFFAVVAWAQLAWAAAIIWRPTRPLLLAGAVGNAAVLAVYLLSRTTGLPIGPGSGTAEPAGGLDVACSVFELLILAGALLAASAPRRPVALASTAGVAAGTTAVVIAVTTAVFTPSLAGPEAPTAAAAVMPGMSQAAHTGLPPMKMSGPTTAPTAAQIAAADQLIKETTAGIAKYRNIKVAEAAGYRPMGGAAGEEHYINESYLGGGLDPQHPQSLVYATQVPGHAPVLLGAMFLSPPGRSGPDVGGSLTRWHQHSLACINGRLNVSGPHPTNHTCSAASTSQYSAQMLHVWVVPYPGGPFSDNLSRTAVQSAVKQALATK